MGKTLTELYVKINDSDIRRADAAIDKMHGTINKLDPSIAKMESGFGKVNATLVAMGGLIGTAAIVRLGTDVVGSATKMDQLNRMLVNVEGSLKAAKDRFEEFRVLAKAPVLDPQNLAASYVGLRSVNIEAELAIRFMKGLGNAMAGVGAGNEQFVNVMYQFVQMGGATKLLGQDLRVINESFPQMRKFLIEAFGSADPEKLAKEGHTAVEVFQRLTDIFEKLPHFAGGAKAAQENFTQSLQLFEAAIAKDVLPRISDFLTKLTDLMDKFSALPDSTKAVIGDLAIGGGGLLGIAFAIGAINKALEVLGMSAGLQALTSGALGATAGGLPQYKNIYKGGIFSSAGEEVIGRQMIAPAAGFMAGLGLNIPTLSVAAMMVGSLVWAGEKIYGAFTRDFTPEERSAQWTTAQGQKSFAVSRFREYQMGAGNFPNKTLSEIVPTEDAYQGLMDLLGQDYEKWRNKTFAQLEKALTMPGKMYNAPAGPPESLATIKETISPELQKSLDKMADDVFDATIEFNKSTIEYYASKIEGKFKLKERTLKAESIIPPRFAEIIKSNVNLSAENFNRTLTSMRKPVVLTDKEIEAQIAWSRGNYGAAGPQQSWSATSAAMTIQRKKEEFGSQDYGKDLRTKEEIVGIESDLTDKERERFQMSATEEAALMDRQMNYYKIMNKGDEDVGLAWSKSINHWVNLIEGSYDIISKLMDKMGIGLDKTTQKHVIGMLSGAAEGAAIGTAIMPGWGTAIGAGIGAVAGYQEGGWGIVTKPTMFIMGENYQPEAFNIQPLSKGGRSIGGTYVHIENLNVPYSPDPQAAENMVGRAIDDLRRHGRL